MHNTQHTHIYTRRDKRRLGFYCVLLAYAVFAIDSWPSLNPTALVCSLQTKPRNKIIIVITRHAGERDPDQLRLLLARESDQMKSTRPIRPNHENQSHFALLSKYLSVCWCVCFCVLTFMSVSIQKYANVIHA